MKMGKVLIWLMLAVIIVPTANAAWISYTGNQGTIVAQQLAVPQPVAQQPQIIPSYKSPQSLDSPQVKLVKLADKTTSLPGGTITYTITATNEGTDTITNIAFVDAIPSYTTFLDAGGCGTVTYCHNDSGIDFNGDNTQPVTHVQWILGEMPYLATATFVLKVEVK